MLGILCFATAELLFWAFSKHILFITNGFVCRTATRRTLTAAVSRGWWRPITRVSSLSVFTDPLTSPLSLTTWPGRSTIITARGVRHVGRHANFTECKFTARRWTESAVRPGSCEGNSSVTWERSMLRGHVGNKHDESFRRIQLDSSRSLPSHHIPDPVTESPLMLPNTSFII